MLKRQTPRNRFAHPGACQRNCKISRFDLQPQFNAPAQTLGELVLDKPLHFLGVITRAEVSADNQLVLETICPFQEIIQVHMPEFVNLLTAMIWANEAHFGNEDLRLIHCREIIQSSWTR